MYVPTFASIKLTQDWDICISDFNLGTLLLKLGTKAFLWYPKVDRYSNALIT